MGAAAIFTRGSRSRRRKEYTQSLVITVVMVLAILRMVNLYRPVRGGCESVSQVLAWLYRGKRPVSSCNIDLLYILRSPVTPWKSYPIPLAEGQVVTLQSPQVISPGTLEVKVVVSTLTTMVGFLSQLLRHTVTQSTQPSGLHGREPENESLLSDPETIPQPSHRGALCCFFGADSFR